jgi:hypothetical protein
MFEFQKAYCLKMLDKIEKRPIASFFRDAPSPDTEYMGGYLERPKKPMDLRTVRQRLVDGTYKTMNEWGVDVRLIWSNAHSCYPPESPIYLIALELSAWFEKKWANYPRTQAEHWATKLKKIRPKIRQLRDGMPIRTDLIPQPAPKG